MADKRYGGDDRRESWRERGSSIFSDDNDDRWSRGSGRWSSEHGRGSGWSSGGSDDRGFFERAGDEVRSWFGDEEAERRRERDIRRDEGRSAFGGGEFEREQNQYGRQESWGRGEAGDDYRRSQYGGRQDRERTSSGGWGSLLGDSPDRDIRRGSSRHTGSGGDWSGGDHRGSQSGTGRQYQERFGGGHGGGAWGGGGFGGSQSSERGTSSSSWAGGQESCGQSGQGGSRSQWDDN